MQQSRINIDQMTLLLAINSSLVIVVAQPVISKRWNVFTRNCLDNIDPSHPFIIKDLQ